MFESLQSEQAPEARMVWPVGALCKAVGEALAMRFNPVQVRGELSGLSRAASGHWYFSLKDAQGQLRCAMFRSSAQAVSFQPRDGDLVEVSGRMGVYEARGDLQLVVTRMAPVGQGALHEQFLRLKDKLQAQGLFDADRKRPLPEMPRGIGLVTSLGAAALQDVLTALQRRAPHVPVWLAPALVQGQSAAASLCHALAQLYERAEQPDAPPIDTILLVRGGGSLEDLWSFNDEQLAFTIARSPVPVIAGVGHETDFTIADFVADVRAPTPTAAAELVSRPQADLLQDLGQWQTNLQRGTEQRLQQAAQRVDWVAMRLSRPTQRLDKQRLALVQGQARLSRAVQQQVDQQQRGLDDSARILQGRAKQQLERAGSDLQQRAQRLQRSLSRDVERRSEALARLSLRLSLLNPQLVLNRGYSLLVDDSGRVLSRTAQLPVGQAVRAHVSDGQIDLTVTHPRLI